MAEKKKYVYPHQTKEQQRKEAAERYQQRRQLLIEREEQRRQAAKPRCWQVGWDESRQAKANRVI